VSLCALAACSKSQTGPTVDHTPHDAAVTTGDAPVTQGDAPVTQVDAAMTPVDAGSTSSGEAGVVSCYTEGDPSQSCTLPSHCCFSNYSSQHDGFCAASACVYGTISCDGPEDCASGQHCCSHALFASDGSLTGYSIGCQATACGAAPVNYELCHTSGPACSNGGTCVTAYLNDNDLPRTLDICQ